MISKIGRVRDSWFMKAVLTLTALSFMSLFGVAGWLGGKKNRPVIKVDDVLVYQDQIGAQFEQELQMAKNIFGDQIDIDDSIKNAMLQGIVQRELTNSIITRASEVYKVRISDELIRKIIFSQAEFMDSDGKFNPSRFRQLLSMSGWSEQKYIDMLRLDVEKQHMVYDPISNINVPNVLVENMVKLENQSKIFDYIKVDPSTINVTRNISDEELEQYYQDFSASFMEPEKRDVSYISLSLTDVEAKIVPSQSEIEAYYASNKEKFETPETRDVLQMAFDTKEEAEKAMSELNSGSDFIKVAKTLAKQNEAETKLGYVSKDMLIYDLAENVFESKTNSVVGPTKSELGWHIMKVVGVKSGSKMNKAESDKKIVAELKKEKGYEEADKIIRNLEDKIASGASLEDIAKDMNVKVHSVKNLTEDGNVVVVDKADAEFVKTDDFVDNAFSYNTDEISQVVETDHGYFVLKVDAITDTHLKDIALVRGDIEKMWLESERNAIAQEIINDVMHDLETGDKIPEIAERFKLKLSSTKPLTRNGSFEKLDGKEMLEIFQTPIGEAQVINKKGVQLIVVAKDVIAGTNKISKEEANTIKLKTKADFTRTCAAQMVDSYGSDYDVRVKYRLLGLAD